MKKITLLFPFLFFSILFFGQNKHISLGYKSNGLCIGNSKHYNGLRINLFDKNVDIINGVNILFFSKYKKCNGIKFSIQSNSKYTNGVNITLWGSVDQVSNGVSFATSTNSYKNNGLGIGLLSFAADTMNGFFFSGIVGTTNWTYDYISIVNGVTIGIIIGVQSKILNGVAVGAYNETQEQNGLVIGIYNETDKLYGMQIGLWNVAKNKKYFKRMPFINFNFRRNNLNCSIKKSLKGRII